MSETLIEPIDRVYDAVREALDEGVHPYDIEERVKEAIHEWRREHRRK